MGRGLAILGGVLVLTLLAVGLTEATLAVGHRGGLTDDALVRPHNTQLVAPLPKSSAKPAASSSPSSTSSPTTVSVPSTQVLATTNAFVHMRAGKSTSTDIVLNLNGGSQVQLLPDSDAQWQQVEYNGTTGYVFKAYLDY